MNVHRNASIRNKKVTTLETAENCTLHNYLSLNRYIEYYNKYNLNNC